MSALLFLLALGGCASVPGERGTNPEARREMERARTLEASGQWRAAADAYAAVAERHPGSDVYASAARKAALLYAHPSSVGNTDTAALRWFRSYLSLPLPAGERESAQIMVSLLEELRATRAALVNEKALQDSISAQLRRQAAAQSHRAQELQAQLEKALDELQRLREIEVKTSRGRRVR